MADSSAETDDSHRDGKHRQSHIQHLNVQVPPVTNVGCFAGFFRPSPTSSSSSPAALGISCVGHGQGQGHGHGHADRPASPSLIRSPSAWIIAKGHSLGSNRHGRRRSREFQYDALSYARNFDEGGTDGEGEEEAGLAASDVHKHRCFTSRLPTSPPPGSPSAMATSGNGKAVVELRETCMP